MEILKNQIVNVWVRDEWYENLRCINYDDNYLICQEATGPIRAFNHRQVKEIICGKWEAMKTQEEYQDEIEIPRPDISEQDMLNMAGGFIPEKQTQGFRLNEMKQCASGEEDFSVARNLGVQDPPGTNVRH